MFIRLMPSKTNLLRLFCLALLYTPPSHICYIVFLRWCVCVSSVQRLLPTVYADDATGYVGLCSNCLSMLMDAILVNHAQVLPESIVFT